jgi:hypothetical protein
LRKQERYGQITVIRYLPATHLGRRVIGLCECGVEGTYYLSHLREGRVWACTLCMKNKPDESISDDRYHGKHHLIVLQYYGGKLRAWADLRGKKTIVTCASCSPTKFFQVPRDLVSNGLCPTCDAAKIKELPALRKEYRRELASLNNARRRIRKQESYISRRIWMCASLHKSSQGDWNFIKFLVEDGYLGRRPEGDYTLERIENDRGYEFDNLLWLPREDQPKNRSNVTSFTFKGQLHTTTSFAKLICVSRPRVNKWLSWGRTPDYIAAHVAAVRNGESTYGLHIAYPWRTRMSERLMGVFHETPPDIAQSAA